MSPSEKPSRHVCPDCGRSYKAAETLNRHRKNHSETTAYTCDICDASFKRKDLLDRHSNIHSNGRQPTSRNRSQRACDRCSRLKTRCDNLVPCTRCTRGGHACTYRLKSSRARTDRSSTASIDTMPSSRSSVDLPGAPDMFQQPQIQVQEDWPGLWQESNIWSWPEVETDPSLQRPPTLVPTSACGVQNNLSPWTGEIDPMLMEPSMLSPFQSVDSDPGSPCSGSSVDQWTSAELQSALTVTAFDDMDLSPAITPFQPSMYAPPQFDYNSLPEPAYEAPQIQNTAITTPQQQKLITELATVALSFSSPFTNPSSRSRLWSNASKKVEQTFNIRSTAPTSPHLFQHFLDLFFQNFTTSCLSSEKRFAAPESHQPYLYLIMIAIGAAYAGTPESELFSQNLLEALRPRLTNASASRESTDGIPMIQALALLQAAMLNFGDRSSSRLPAAQRLNEAMVRQCRRIGLFEQQGGNFGMVEAEERKRLATAVVKLDETVGVLNGVLPLLSDEESQSIGNGKSYARTSAANLRCTLLDWSQYN